MIGIQSGVLGAVVQPIRDAGRAWVATINAKGGLNGHPVRLLMGDDGGDPGRALALAKRFVEQDKVQSFYGNHLITTEQAVNPYLQEKGIPTIGSCNCNPASDESPLVFNLAGAVKGFAWNHLVSIVGQTPAKKLAVLYCREAPGCELFYKNMPQYTEKLGVKIVYAAPMSLAAPDYTAEVVSARNAGAEALIIIAENQSAYRVYRSAKRQGWNAYIGANHSLNDDRTFAVPDAEGLLGTSVATDYATSPGLADYRQAMAKLPGSIKATTGVIGAWIPGLMLEKIAPRFGPEVTPAQIIEGLYSLRGETFGGLLPPITFKRGVPQTEMNLCALPMRVGKGKFEFPKGDQFVCAPGWKPVEP